jgi:PAS domain S-box-containing protein
MPIPLPALRTRMARAIARRGSRPSAETLPFLGGVICLAVGAVVLVGWWLGIDGLKSLVPGLLTMKVNTAIGFVLIGLGLILRATPEGTRLHRWSVAPVAIAIALGASVGSQYLIGRDLGIDQWLFRELPGQVGTVWPNRMSPMTAICFVLVGSAVLLAPWPAARRMVPALLLAASGVASLNVLDAIFEANDPSLLAGSTQMALVTAATFIVGSFGTMGLLPGGGPLDVFAGGAASARLARRLVPAAFLVPLGLEWLRSQGQELGLYGGRYGTSLTVLGTFAIIAGVIWQSTRSARRIETSRLAALEERDRFFDMSIDLLATASADGYFIRLNPAWTAVLGYELGELQTRPFMEFVHPEDVAATQREVERQVDEGRVVRNFQNRYRHRNGSYRWLEWTSSPSADGSLLYATARDVTERRREEEELRAPAMALARRRAAAQERIESVIEDGAFGPVFQPIVDLSTGTTVGYEALTRFADDSRPDEMFATALECGLGIRLETSAIAAALEEARGLPRRAWLSLNVSPTLLADVRSIDAALGLRARPLVLEITEHEPIEAYGPLREAVLRLGPDIRLAVDDAGAGVANFHHLVELRPDFVKIDAGLVRGVDLDVGRQAVVAGILHFAAAAGCQVIAEGIETDAELAAVTELGVTLGQGYLLGRPAPVEAWLGPKKGLSSAGPSKRQGPPARPIGQRAPRSTVARSRSAG